MIFSSGKSGKEKKKQNKICREHETLAEFAKVSNELEEGDIVWGKVHGHPWWPGRILSFHKSQESSGDLAHVGWFASNTQSMMPCEALELFLSKFTKRFTTKKSGLYVTAVKEAQIASREKYS